MKAIYIKTETQSESEADYETAIDIAYYTFNKTEHLFKLKSVNLSFVMEENNTTTASMEEDYDEETGKTNGWKQINNNDESSSINYFIQLSLPEKIALLSQEKALSSLKHKYEYIDYNYQMYEERYSLSENDFKIIDDYIVKNHLEKNKECEIITSSKLNELIDNINNEIIETLRKNVINAQENLSMIENAKKILKNEAESEKSVINYQMQNLFLYEKDSYDTAEKIIDLIKKGADFSVKNDIGDTYLMIAARKNMNIVCKEVLQHLSEYREDFLENNVKFSFDSQNEDGENLLMIFTKRGNKELVEVFLDSSNSTNALYQTNKFNKDVYSFAKDYGRKEIIKTLDSYKEKLTKKIESRL